MHVRDTVIRRSRCRSLLLLACRYVSSQGSWEVASWLFRALLVPSGAPLPWGLRGEDEGGLLVMNGMYTCILGFVWLVVVGGRD